MEAFQMQAGAMALHCSIEVMEAPAAAEWWVHPYVTLEEVTQFVAAFLDLLRLASGLQSSARPFVWSPQALHKALAWAQHLEQVITDFPASEEGFQSRRTLDDALTNLVASAPTFPPGLPRLSASELSNARRLFLQALLQAVAPDSDYFQSITDCLNGLEGESVKAEISARNSALRCAESLKQFVASLVACSLASENKQITSFWDSPAELADENIHKAWTRNAMEYVTSYDTMYKVAAANLIFKSGEQEWRTALDTSRAYASSTMAADDTEIAELCCLQLGYSDSRDLAFRIATSTDKVCHTDKVDGEGALSSIEAFLIEIMEKQVDLWWKLSPVLLAGVCAPRYSLLKTYLDTLTKEAQVGCKCRCHSSSKTCQSCQQCSSALLERLWCFHPKLRTFEAQQVESVCKHLLNQARMM